MTPSGIAARSSIPRSSRRGAGHPDVAWSRSHLLHHVVAHAGELAHVAFGQRRGGGQLDGHRIHVDAVSPQREVEMRAGRQTAGADAADHLPDLDVRSHAHVAGDRLEMGIARLDSRAVIHLDVAAGTTLPACVLDLPRSDGSHGGYHRGCEVHAEMGPVDAEQRVEPRRGELRGDTGEFQWIAQEGTSEGSPLWSVVATSVVVGFEV